MDDEKAGKVSRSAGRFGVRYGRAGRKAVADVEEQMNEPQACPECDEPRVERTDTGIWECGKCGHRFAGGCYAVETPGGQAVERAIAEALEETEDDEEDTEE